MIRESKLDEYHLSALVGFDDSFGSVNGAKIGYLASQFALCYSKIQTKRPRWGKESDDKDTHFYVHYTSFQFTDFND